jgi:hypothetical protein
MPKCQFSQEMLVRGWTKKLLTCQSFRLLLLSRRATIGR